MIREMVMFHTGGSGRYLVGLCLVRGETVLAKGLIHWYFDGHNVCTVATVCNQFFVKHANICSYISNSI